MTAPLGAGRSRLGGVVAGALLVGQFVVLYFPDASSVPGADLPVPFLDKLVHVGVFALPTWALLRVVRRPGVVVGAMLAQAAVSELVQEALLPGRGFEALDVVADVVGVGLGLVLAGHRPGRRGPRTPLLG
nr:VanZ family protein [Propionibacterium sp.]